MSVITKIDNSTSKTPKAVIIQVKSLEKLIVSLQQMLFMTGQSDIVNEHLSIE